MNQNNQISRIAFVSTMAGVAWGGSEELWCQSALHLRKLGHEIHVSVFDWGGRPARVAELEAAGAQMCYRVRKQGILGRTLEKIRGKVSASGLEQPNFTWLKNTRPDLVVISQGYPFEGIAWMAACEELDLPYCTIVQAHSEIWWPEDSELAQFRQAYVTAKRVYFVSHANHQLLEMQCGTRLANGEVVFNPWKVDATEPVPWPESDETINIACVGRIDPRAKAQDLLLQVLAEEKWKQRPVRLNFYGEGPCEESVRAMAAMLGADNVTFKGQVANVRDIWAANHALVLPSRYEGLPLVIIEAMLCGRIAITTEIAGNTEYITEGVSGFIAAAPARALVDDAMERAWAKRAEWREMGLKARSRLLESIPANPIETFSSELARLAAGDGPLS